VAASSATPGASVPAPAGPSRAAASPATGRPLGSAPAAEAATAGSTEARDLDEVAATFRHLAERLGKSPSDQALADELGVGRSRAQQLRTAAIKAGHADLAKPLSAAS
jgi:predicted transcriptional regulator